jgi:Tfp pilus assembly protein PilO
VKTGDLRVWIAGSAAVALLVALLGWFMLIGPKLSDTSALRHETESAQQANTKLQAEIAVLNRERAGLPKLVNKLSLARQELPVGDALPAFEASTSAHALADHVSLTSMIVGAVAPVDAAGGVIDAPITAPAGHLFAIPVTIVSDGSYGDQLRFLAAVQRAGPRVALLTGARFAPTEQSKSQDVDQQSSLTTTMSVFVAPLTTQQDKQLAKQLAGSH